MPLLAGPSQIQQGIPIQQKGAANGVATLDANGLIPIAEIPASTATTIRATVGTPVVLSTDIVGDFAYDADAQIMYGPLAGTPVTGHNWNTSLESSADIVPIAPNASETYHLPAGVLAESIDGRFAEDDQVTMVAGQLWMNSIYLPKGLVVGHMSVMIGGTGAATPTHQWMALYDGSRAQLAISSDLTTTAITAFFTISYPVATVASGGASTFTTTYSGLHYVGWMVAGGTPTCYGLPSNPRTNRTPGVGGHSDTGQTTPPSFPHTAGSITFLGSAQMYATVET